MTQTAFRILISLFLIISFVILSFPARRVARASHADDSTRSGKDARKSDGIRFERPPVRFEINEGQSDPQVRFTARERDGLAYLTPAGATLQITRPAPTPDPKPGQRGIESSFVRLKTAGANPNPRITGLERLPGVTNYFIGSDKSKWRTNVAAYAKVKYEEVYQGIDLVYYGNDGGRLEYDFIVKPGADPDQIAVSIEGAENVELDSSGDLVISAATGKVRQPAPRIYQEVNGERQQISGRYRLFEGEKEIRDSAIRNPQVAFELAEYDESREMVIDPEVVYATYMGGSSTTFDALDTAGDVTVDEEGSVYIVGTAASADFPTRFPLQGAFRGSSDAFVTKLDPNGQLVYSTYLGGSLFDGGNSIEVDATGAAYVGGTTSSDDFPTVNPIPGVRGNGADVFIAKLSSDGSQIVYSTVIGGSDTDSVADLALDAENNLHVLGNTFQAGGVPASDFPTVNPLQATNGGGFSEGFWSVISANGSSLLFSTYLGGDGKDLFGSIDVDPSSGNVYLSYFTDSSNFPASGSSVITPSAGGAPEKGVLGFRREEVIDFWILLDVLEIGSSESAEDISPDSGVEARFITVLGSTLEGYIVDVILTPHPAPPSGKISSQEAKPQADGGLDARITVLDQDLNVTNTVFFGGSREETVSALAIDSRGAVYLTGHTRSNDLPTVNPIQATQVGSLDGFLAVFHPQTLAPVFATYLGGSGLDEISGVAVDEQGNIYVVGLTFSTDFPTATPGAVQDQLRGISDAFIIKISPVDIPSEPDFTLSVDTPEITVARGAKANLSININRIAGFDGQVTVTSPNSKPIKVKIKPKQRSTIGDQVSFTIKVKPAGVVGEHDIVFSATDNSGRTRTATLKLIIE